MKIIVDNRETELYNLLCVGGGEAAARPPHSLLFDFKDVESEAGGEVDTKKSPSPLSVDLVKRKLDIGDIIFTEDDETTFLSIIERKTLSDLISSLRDGRYEEQSYRLRYSSGMNPHNIIYLIEGEIYSHIKNKDLIYSAIVSLNHFKGFSVIRTRNIEETRDFLQAFFNKLKKERAAAGTDAAATAVGTTSSPPVAAYHTVVKSVKKENITPENIGEIILCNIPGVNSVSAAAIMKNMTSLDMLMNELKTNPSFLENIYTETNGKKRKLSKSVIKSIPIFLGLQSMLLNQL